jgi:hypothetical protein
MTADDFPSAAVRHLDDAQVLADARRPDGAVHAAGFAAECALKALLVRAASIPRMRAMISEEWWG